MCPAQSDYRDDRIKANRRPAFLPPRWPPGGHHRRERRYRPRVCLAYARSGAEVVLVSRTRENFWKCSAAVEAAGGQAHVIRADVGKLEEIRSIEQKVSANSCRARELALVLVNCAGFAFTKPALDITEEDWDRILDVHAKGTFFCSQSLGRLMIERGYGKIINLSSTWSVSTDMGKSVYGAAKAGVSYLTAALSTEWAPLGVRVNAIAPTSTLTENTSRIVPRKRSARAAIAQPDQTRAVRGAFRPGRRSRVPGKPSLGFHHRTHAFRRWRLARRPLTEESSVAQASAWWSYALQGLTPTG